MNHLGGMERMVCVEWLLRGLRGVSHLWKATQEQRDLRYLVFRSLPCSHMEYGLCLDHIGCNNLVKWTDGGRVIGWNASIWSKGRLLKDLVSMHVESCGESAPPLEKEKSKYLVVSPATDNLSIKTLKLSRIFSSQFLS